MQGTLNNLRTFFGSRYHVLKYDDDIIMTMTTTAAALTDDFFFFFFEFYSNSVLKRSSRIEEVVQRERALRVNHMNELLLFFRTQYA